MPRAALGSTAKQCITMFCRSPCDGPEVEHGLVDLRSTERTAKQPGNRGQCGLHMQKPLLGEHIHMGAGLL
eukprot:1231696-Prorocentrum_lima.AAC.1